MAIPLSINGQVFEYPQNFDEEWGVSATGWAQAVTAGALYLSGGNFPLTAQVDFGSSFGIKVKSVLTETINPATSGYIALAKTDTIVWRNNLNNANLALGIDGSNNLTFNGTAVGTASLTNNHIYVGNGSNVPTDVPMSGDATIIASGALTISNGAITNAKVSASAAIALTKLAAQTANRATAFDSGGLLVPSPTTDTQLGYLSTATSDVQTQLDARLPLSGGTMSGAISMASNKITSLTAGSSTGDAVNFGQLTTLAGTIKQAVQATTTSTTSTSSTSYVDTALTATITPSSAASKVRIVATGQLSTATANNNIYVTIARGGTNLVSANGIASALLNQATFSDVRFPWSATYYDSPTSTSALTYTIRIKSESGGGVQFNESGNTAILILEEILQ